MSTNSTIFTGTWINYSRGAIFGSTLTLPSSLGAVLISGLALYVTFTATRTWSILCFFIHRIGTSHRPRDGLDHQIQATLRNNASDLQSMWQLTKMAWSWGSPRSRSFQKAISVIIFALGHLALFTALGLLSSRLILLDDEVLIRSLSNCGSWDLSGTIAESSDPLQAILDYNTHRSFNAELTQQYVRDCYTGQQTSTECSSYKSVSLKYTSNTNTPCPVSEAMCLGPVNGAVGFDTGLLDSCNDLGINAAMKDRVQFRKVMTCSPLITEGYIQYGKVEFDGQKYNYTAGYYGASQIGDWSSDVGFENATFFLADPGTQYDHDIVAGNIVYNLQ
jgi:hypothetical protein